ncbi:MAG: hypothetical protein LBR83_02675 [Clostridiales bacterium]|jgi:hypothetical protein|nr:hypothetical protein [Clostridiales bacterium]
MKTTSRLSDKEYDELSAEYEITPPELSGKPGFLSYKREAALVTELLPPYYAQIVNTKAAVMSLSPSEVIQHAIKSQLKESV